MKVRILFRDYEISDTNKQQLLYGVAVLVSILSVFSIIFMLSYYSDDPATAAFPSPTGSSAFTNNLSRAAKPNQQVAGAQTQNQQPLPREEPKGPEIPPPKPSPSASPSPSLSPSPSPTPAETPTPTPSPTPTPAASQAPDNRPKITNIQETEVKATSIKLKFSVDKTSDCKAIYWTDSNNKHEQESSTKRTTSPEVSITGLTASTEYTYSVSCNDPDNGTGTAGDYKFKTSASE